MRRPATRRIRLTALGLEVVGVMAVLIAIATINVWTAVALGGIVLVVAASFLEVLL